LTCLLLAGVVFYSVNVAHYEGQPLRIEENEWPPMGRAVYEHGIPVISASENHRLRLLPSFQRDTADYNGLWHPPLYMYTMAGVMTIAGPDAAESLRLIGVAGLLSSCLLLFLISRELFGRNWFRIGAAASALLLVHPYAIQGSLFLDIDTSIYAPTFLLFSWLLIRFDARRFLEPLPTLALAASFALILWVKLPTAFVLVPVGALYWILRKGFLRGLLQTLAVFVGGAAFFLATYGLYVEITDQSFWYMFDFTLVQKGGRLFWKQDATTLENATYWHVAWFTPALLLVTGAYGVVALQRWWLTRSVNGLDFVWALGLAIYIAYAFVSPNGTVYQGKYAFPAIALLVFTAAAFLIEATRDRPDRMSVYLAIFVAVVAAVVAPDFLTDQHFAALHGGVKVATVVGSAGALWIAARGISRRSLIPVGALVVCFALFAAQSVRSYRADTSPMYPTTDTQDFWATADFMRRQLGPGEVALTSKNLGFYMHGNVIEGEDIWLVRGDAFEAQALEKLPQITVVGTDTFGPPLGAETLKVISRCFRERSFGHGKVYTRKPQCGGQVDARAAL
jgi:hypothetical protein